MVATIDARWLLLPALARAVWGELHRIAGASGRVAVGVEPAGQVVATLLGAHPSERLAIRRLVDDLLGAGFLVLEPGALVVVGGRSSGAERTARWRASRRASQASPSVTPATSPRASPSASRVTGDVTRPVTGETSHGVTPCPGGVGGEAPDLDPFSGSPSALAPLSADLKTVDPGTAGARDGTNGAKGGAAKPRGPHELACRRCGRVLGFRNTTGYHPKCDPAGQEKCSPPQKRTPEETAGYRMVVDTYFAGFEAKRGRKPLFGGADGRAAWRLIDKAGGADAAVEVVRAAFAHDFWATRVTIVDIAKDPSRYLGSVGGRTPARNAQPVQRSADFDDHAEDRERWAAAQEQREAELEAELGHRSEF